MEKIHQKKLMIFEKEKQMTCLAKYTKYTFIHHIKCLEESVINGILYKTMIAFQIHGEILV